MFEHSTLRPKERRKSTAATAQFCRLQKGLRAALLSSEGSEAQLIKLLKEEEITSPKLLSALPTLTEKMIFRLSKEELLDQTAVDKLYNACRSIDFEAIEEAVSPLHEPLGQKPFYQQSDRATQGHLRLQAERYRKRHRLSPEQAARLWEGEPTGASLLRTWLFGKCLLWLPLLFTLFTCTLLALFLVRRLDLWAIALLFPLICPIWEGFSSLTEGALRLLTPAAPLPALKRKYAPPVCAMLVASAEDDPKRTLLSLEMLIAANREADGLFGLILTLPDAPTPHTSADHTLCEPFLQAFGQLEKNTDRPLRLCIAERSYLPQEKRWRGSPSPDELPLSLAAMLSGEHRRFSLIAGNTECRHSPIALYIAPANSILSPDGLRSLACTLFHPLCRADCVLPLLRTTDASENAELTERLQSLTKRQVTLQKLGRPLVYPSLGMIRLSALDPCTDRLPSLSCALASGSLFVHTYPIMPSAAKSEEGRLLEWFPPLRASIGSLLRLPLYLMLIAAPPAVSLLGLLLSNADLIVQSLFSRPSVGGVRRRFRRHFTVSSLPNILRAGKLAVGRLVFSPAQCFASLPYTDRLPRKRYALCSALFSVSVGILTAALLPLPFSAIGLVWAASPIFYGYTAKKLPIRSLAPSDEAKLLSICRKNWAFFEKFVTPEHPLPPARCKALPSPRPLSDTTPDAFAFYLIACLCACDLGMIDPFTLEKRVGNAITAWEALPTYHGLPYTRYSLETADCCEQSGVDTSLCASFALAMATVAQGLAEYAKQNPALDALSRRVDALWQKMSFDLLYDTDRSNFCESLSPSGERSGSLDLLMSGAGSAAIAALALGQIDRSAWKALRRPAVGNGMRFGMRSTYGSLEEYLLPALFLPAAKDSLIGRARRYALSTRHMKGDAPSCGYSFAYTFTGNGKVSDKALPSGDPKLAVVQHTAERRLLPPHAAFLTLPFRPIQAMKRIAHFERMGALGRFGFYEAIELSQGEQGRVINIWSSAHLGQSMAAVVNYLPNDRFQRRLMQNPSFAALEPLLNEPFDRIDPDCPPIRAETPVDPPDHAQATAGFSSLFLLGDSRWGLIWANGRRMLLFRQGQAMAYPCSPHEPYSDGAFSGLLFFRDERVIAAPATLYSCEAGALTLVYRDRSASLYATLRLEQTDLLSLELSTDCIGQTITALFCYTPISSEGKAFSLETVGDRLLLLSAATWVAAISAEGLGDCFIRAEEAPLPLGEANLPSLLERVGCFTEGSLLTPTCKLGGRFDNRSNCRFLLAFGRDRADVLDKIAHADIGRSDKPTSSPVGRPLPDKEGDSLSLATALQLQFLFEHLKLRSVASPPNTLTPAHLQRCLDEGLKSLVSCGFECDETPCFLPESPDLPTDERLKRCLNQAHTLSITSPPMPLRTRIKLTDTALTIQKGRDLPALGRLYEKRGVALYADTYKPAFRFEGSDTPIPIVLTLPQTSDTDERSSQTSLRPLFYGAAEVSYHEASVGYTGKDYSVTASLSDKYPLLIIEVSASEPADIRLGLPEPEKTTEDSRFWHRTDAHKSEKVDFCSRIVHHGQTVFLLGSFDRSADRLYYLIREELNAQLCDRPLPVNGESESSLLTWQSRPPYPTPLLLHPALASNDPACFPLLLMFRPSAAYDALVRLFSTNDQLGQVAACLLWERSTDDRDALRQAIAHSTDSGEVTESVYLSAARALDALCEASEQKALYSPLLDRLVAEFAELAHRMGDFSGEEGYRKRLLERPVRAVSLDEAAKHAEHDRSLESIASLLLAGNAEGARAWKQRIDTLPLFPDPIEAGALWSLFWYGILGYSETPSAFTLRPLPCDDMDGYAFTLKRRETVYRIRITFSDHSECLLDHKSAEMLFLFDKKVHFLEITVEKSPQIV